MLARLPARFLTRFLVLLSALALLAMGGVAPAAAAEPGITVTGAWARAGLLPGRPGALYFVIENRGDADRLLEVTTTAAGRTEIHTHMEEGGVMKMRKLPGLDIPAASTVTFEPRGHHVMLFEPRSGLREGEEISVTLIFEQAGEVTVTAPVKGMRPAAQDSGHESHDAHGDH